MNDVFDSDINFGDCEIREIIFDPPNVLVIIFDPHLVREIHVKIFNVTFCILASNHMQNVIEDIHVFSIQQLEKYRREFGFVADAIKFPSNDVPMQDSAMICFFEGIAGGEMFVVGDRVEKSIVGGQDKA